MATLRQIKEEKESTASLEERVTKLEQQVAELKEENGVMARILDAMTSDDEIKDAPVKATPASMKKK